MSGFARIQAELDHQACWHYSQLSRQHENSNKRTTQEQQP